MATRLAEDVRMVNVEEDTTPAVLKTMLVFTIMMVTLPIASYFLGKAFIFEAIFGINEKDSYFYSAILAIVIVHIILAMFIYVAFQEGTKTVITYKKD